MEGEARAHSQVCRQCCHPLGNKSRGTSPSQVCLLIQTYSSCALASRKIVGRSLTMVKHVLCYVQSSVLNSLSILQKAPNSTSEHLISSHRSKHVQTTSSEQHGKSIANALQCGQSRGLASSRALALHLNCCLPCKCPICLQGM